MSDVKRIRVIEDGVDSGYCAIPWNKPVLSDCRRGCRTGAGGIRNELPSIVLLDLMLPGMSGVALAKQKVRSVRAPAICR